MAGHGASEQVIPPDQVKTGDILTRNVIDYSVPGGKVLFEKGNTLDEGAVSAIRKSGISNIFIRDRAAAPAQEFEFIGAGAERAFDRDTGELRVDSSKASDLHENITRFTCEMLNTVADNANFDIKKVREATGELQAQIRSNEPAMVSLAHLRDVDQYTFMHSVNVAVFSLMLADRAGLSQQEQTLLGTGAILHDIGKMAVDQTVLNKPGRLSEEEFMEIKHHARKGYLILKDRGIEEPISRISLTHHEKLNGKGYPLGITADRLSVPSRISAIVDIYDALTADRVYKKALHPSQAFEILEKESGTGLDADLLKLFRQTIGRYPISSEVLLVNGSVARVVEQNREDLDRPIIEVIWTRFGKRPEKRIVINLMTSGNSEYSIKGIHKTH